MMGWRYLGVRSSRVLAASVFGLSLMAIVVAALVLGRPQTVPATSPPIAIASSTPNPSITASPVPSPRASRVPPDVANNVLANDARATGRSEVAICLYVDPSTGLDAGATRASLQSSVDTLVRQGYTALGATPVVLCPVFIRTSTVHPKNSGSGLPVGTTARVTTPSPILLFVAVTTPSRINFIFGGLTTRRGAEEATCAGDNCREVTGSIYSGPTAFASAVERENLIMGGLGLDGPGK